MLMHNRTRAIYHPRDGSLLSCKNPFAHLGYFCLLVLLVGSCVTLPAQLEEPVAVPEEFSASGESKLLDRWWESFDDVQLNELMTLALSNNFSLRSTWDRLAQAEAVARKAGADRFPIVDGQGEASRTEIHSDSDSSESFNDFSLGAGARYELDLWGRIRSTQDAARLDVKASEKDLQAAAMTLSSQVASTWYQLVEQYGQLELLEGQLDTNQKVLELVTLRFRRGQVGATDVLQQRQLVESVRGDMTSVQSRAEVFEHQLAILLGQAPRVKVSERRTRLAELPPMPDTGVPLDVIQRRPDIQAAYYIVLAADQRTAAAIAERFPRISLSAQASTSSEHVRDLFDNWIATLAANLVAPIIDGGARRAEVDRARAVTSQSLNDYGQVIIDSLGEVENALAQEGKQHELIESLSKQLELSKEVIQRIRDNYTHGAVDYLRVLDALLTDQQLERRLLQARRELIGYRIDLYRALGGDWVMTQSKPRLPNTKGSS